MAVNSFLSNQGTQSALLTDNTGGASGTLIPVMKIATDAAGTFSTLWDGNVGGTVQSQQNGGWNVNISGINNITPVSDITNGLGVYPTTGTIGLVNTINIIGTLPNLPQGSINVTAGTIATLGTMGTLGLVNTVTNLTSGSVRMTVGTITEGTIRNLISGTINAATAILNSGTINLGTVVGKDAPAAARTGNPFITAGTDSGGSVYAFLTDTKGQQYLGGGTVSMLNAGTISVLPNLPQGSINVTAGTIATLGTMGTLGLVNTVTTVSNLTNGSIKVTAGTEIVTSGSINVIAGTVNAGTINVGTFQINPLPATNTISHAGTSGTLGIGTLVAAASFGAGTAGYITNYRIVVISGSAEVILAFGTQVNGNQVIHHGGFPAGGGISSSIPYPHGYGTTNSPLTYQILSGSGTVSWDVDYFPHT